MIETGRLLQDRYRIERQIGQGGMGAVYLATDERFGSRVAIKETLCMGDHFRKAIEREARLLNSLKHAALPRVSDHFAEDDGQFIVMEFIPGEDLSMILEENGEPFSVSQVKEWAEQLLDALEFLHTQSTPVIHRDIKPQNLKITSRGQIILLDFGLAKGNPTDAAGHTAAKSIFGYSRNYASLEQIQGTGTDPRSDLYSLAATLYHLVTGRPPEDALTRAMNVLSGQPDPLIPANSINEDVPAGFAGVLAKTLDLNAGVRPASAAEMKQMFREMDRYAEFAEGSFSYRAAEVDAFAAESTRLLPGTTRATADRQTDVKTKLLPRNLSEDTVPGTGNKRAASVSMGGHLPVLKRHRSKVYAVAGVTLLLGGLAAGSLLLDGNATYTGDKTESTPSSLTEGSQNEASSALKEPDAESVAIPSSEQNGGPTRVWREPAKNASEQRQDTATARGTRPSTGRGAEFRSSNTVDDGIRVDGDTIYVGNIRIGGGRIDTPSVKIDEKGIVPKTPPVRQSGPFTFREFRRLTPEQEKRLEELRRRGLMPPEDPRPPMPRRPPANNQ